MRVDLNELFSGEDPDLTEGVAEEIKEHWIDAWNLNTEGDKTTPAFNFSLSEMLGHFIANEFEFYSVDPHNKTHVQLMLAFILSAVSQSGTHSRSAVKQAVSQMRKQINGGPSFKSFKWVRSLRAKLACLWLIGIGGYALIFSDADFYYNADESWFFMKLALAPPVFALFALWLLNKRA